MGYGLKVVQWTDNGFSLGLGFSDGGGGISCGYTEYFNGTGVLIQPFTNRAPLNLIEDSLDSGTITSLDLDQDWNIELKVNIDASASNFDNIFSLEGVTGANLTISYHTANAIQFFLTDDLSTLRVNKSVSYVANTDAIIIMNNTGSTISGSVNGVAFTPILIDLATNGCNVGNVTVAANDPDFRELESLYYYANMDILDNWDFISNVSDGLIYRGSVNGINLLLKDDNPTTAQYPNYTPSNADDIVRSPATGPMSFVSTSPVDTIKSTFSFDPDQDWNYDIENKIISLGSINDRTFVIYDSGNPSTNYVRAIVTDVGAGGRWRIQCSTINHAVVTSDFVTNIPLDTWKVYGFRYDKSIGRIYATIDGVDTADWETVDFTGVTFDTIVIGTDIALADNMTQLVKSSYSNLVGNTNFNLRLREQNDANGNNVTSSLGAVYVVADEAPSGIWYPYFTVGYNTAYRVEDKWCGDCNQSTFFDGTTNQIINFNWSDGDAYPMTGPIRLAGDIITNTLGASVDLYKAGTETFSTQVKLDSTIENFDEIFNIGNSGIPATSLRVIWRSSGKLELYWVGDTGVSMGFIITAAVPLGEWLDITVTCNSSELTLSVNGVVYTDSSINADTCTIDEQFLGARQTGVFHIQAEMMYFNSTLTGDLNLNTRIWSQGDPNAGKFFDSNSNEWVGIDGAPFGAVYPYYPDLTSYLVSDTPCADNNLQMIDGIAQTINGIFRRIP